MNRRTHVIVGMGSGAAVAMLRARGQDPWKQLAEAAGGALGGFAGARAPDVLEPAVHSWHRDTCHSVAAAGAIVVAVRRGMHTCETKCRTVADDFASRRAVLGAGDPLRLLLLLAEVACRMAAGFLNGLAAGYVSHLALDAVTPRSIPLLSQALV